MKIKLKANIEQVLRETRATERELNAAQQKEKSRDRTILIAEERGRIMAYENVLEQLENCSPIDIFKEEAEKVRAATTSALLHANDIKIAKSSIYVHLGQLTLAEALGLITTEEVKSLHQAFIKLYVEKSHKLKKKKRFKRK